MNGDQWRLGASSSIADGAVQNTNSKLAWKSWKHSPFPFHTPRGNECHTVQHWVNSPCLPMPICLFQVTSRVCKFPASIRHCNLCTCYARALTECYDSFGAIPSCACSRQRSRSVLLLSWYSELGQRASSYVQYASKRHATFPKWSETYAFRGNPITCATVVEFFFHTVDISSFGR